MRDEERCVGVVLWALNYRRSFVAFLPSQFTVSAVLWSSVAGVPTIGWSLCWSVVFDVLFSLSTSSWHFSSTVDHVRRSVTLVTRGSWHIDSMWRRSSRMLLVSHWYETANSSFSTQYWMTPFILSIHFTHSLSHSFIHSVIHTFISFIHSLIHSLIFWSSVN